MSRAAQHWVRYLDTATSLPAIRGKRSGNDSTSTAGFLYEGQRHVRSLLETLSATHNILENHVSKIRHFGKSCQQNTKFWKSMSAKHNILEKHVSKTQQFGKQCQQLTSFWRDSFRSLIVAAPVTHVDPMWRSINHTHGSDKGEVHTFSGVSTCFKCVCSGTRLLYERPPNTHRKGGPVVGSRNGHQAPFHMQYNTGRLEVSQTREGEGEGERERGG